MVINNFPTQQVNKWLKMPKVENREIAQYLSNIENWEGGVAFFVSSISGWLGAVERLRIQPEIILKYKEIKDTGVANSQSLPHPSIQEISLLDNGIDLYNQLRWEFAKHVQSLETQKNYPLIKWNGFAGTEKWVIDFALSLDFEDALRFFSELSAQWILSFDETLREKVDDHLFRSICRFPPY